MSRFDTFYQELHTILDGAKSQISEVSQMIRKDGIGKFLTGSNGEQPKINVSNLMDPVKFKKILVRIIKILIVVELIGALIDGLSNDSWARFTNDLIIAGILFLLWGRITTLLRTKKEEYKRRMDISNQNLKLKDALIFSLLWSDEIFTNIPEDRRRIVVISYSLIAVGIFVAITRFGGQGLMPLALSGALVLAAVNLLLWVASLERDEKENLKTELRLAHDVQVSLMPEHAPVLEGFDIAGISLPAKEVGGDHYDYVFLDDQKTMLGISVFDVSGKGMKAALAAVFTSGAFSTEVKQSRSPAEILTRLNKAVFAHTKRGNFIAFLLTMLNIPEKTLTVANAGQTKPLLISSSGAQWIDRMGVNFPLGMKEDSIYEERTVQLGAGDVLFFLTDGITEAMNANKETFGTDRIEQYIRTINVSQRSSKEILDGLVAAVKTHSGSAAQHDDMTMVVVKVG
ncbi:MAG: PP2C family protein-serine/threonine phosphatase [Bacteroidota bacterium]